jgi:hypothetical protein
MPHPHTTKTLTTMPCKTNILPCVTYVLISLTFIKIIAVVFSTPLMGYANNYDFLRQSSCTGIWQYYPDRPKTSANADSPVNSLVFDGHKDKDLCMRSIDNLFPAAIANFHKTGESVDFREISLWKVLISSVMFIYLFFITYGKINRLSLSLAFFMTFGDLANLLYANTFYLEYSVISSLFFALFSTTHLISSKPQKTGAIVLTFISIIWLGFSKQQYMPLATLLGLICSAALILRNKKGRAAIALALTSLAIPIAYSQMNKDDSGHMRGINFANKTDTFLWTVLPESTDKDLALSKLGLPRKCLKGIGKNWYAPSVQQIHPCPEVESLSRLKLIGLFISDPATFIEPMRKAAIGIHPFYPNYLGHLEDKQQSNRFSYLLLKKSSLSYMLALTPKDYMPFFVLTSIFFCLTALAATTFLIPRLHHIRFFLTMIFLGGLVTVYAISSSVFGDGYVELQKHGVGVLIGIAFQITGAIMAIIHILSIHGPAIKKEPISQ